MILFRWRAAFGVMALAVAAVWPVRLAAQPAGERAAVEPTWSSVAALPNDRPASAVGNRARQFKGFQLNQARLRKLLAEAPQERSRPPRHSAAIIELPMPNGTLARFRFVEGSVMSPALAAKFPEIRTYLGEGVDDPAASVRFDFTPSGFHAQVLSPAGTVYIDPAFHGETGLHTSYYKRDYPRPQDGFQCFVAPDAGIALRGTTELSPGISFGLERSGGNLRTYRLAVGATAEYTAFHGGTVAGGLAAIVTAVNRVTGVYESELAIRLELVANNDLIVYTNASTDPYSNGNPSSLLSQNQTTLDKEIGSANYDLGHVFSTAGGGLAALGVVCVNGMKGQGETGTASPSGDPFYIDYVAHEIGHQFGASHTFNSSTSNCGGGNRNGSTAYERGSGSTIMAYAGICGSDNLQANSDPYFHSASFDEILNFSTGGSGNSCAVVTASGNTAPTVSAGANYTIPQNTPFTLTAMGNDPDGDPLTFCWEERDLGPATAVGAADNGSSPLYRSWNPTASPSRTLPRLQDLLNNTLTSGEVMPTTTRTMNFRVTARDNRAGGGGVNTSDMQVSVAAVAGPFQVTSHNSGGTFSGVQNVTWNVAGTAGAPVNTASVNILLSTNGGLSFPITLLAGTPNDGSQLVVLPNLNSTAGRIKVEAAGNIYFDIGNADFTIIPDIPTPLVTVEAAALVAESCSATNNAIDPGETVTVNFTLKNIGTADLTNLVATLLTINGVMAASGPQTYGALLAGGSAVTLPFSFTATGACGENFATVLHLQEGGADFGQVSRNFNLGTLTASTVSSSNVAEVSIPDMGNSGAAGPFPSTVAVSGVNGTVSKVTVTLNGLGHTWPADVDVLLVGPSGQTLVLLSDAGGGNPVSGLTLTFDDAAPGLAPDVTSLVSGTIKPTNYGGGDSFSSPAPAGPYGATLAVFNGLNPNGDWLLYIQDDATQDAGTLAQGWQLNLTTSNATCCGESPAISELALRQFVSATAVNLGSNVTFSLIVSNSGPDVALAVVVTNQLPAEFGFVSAGSSRGTFTNEGGVQIFNVGELANNEFATLTVEAVALVPGARSNLAVTACTTLDPIYTNNSVSTSVYVNAFPHISPIAQVTTNEDSVAGPLSFTVGDAETPAVALVLSAISSDTNLVPPANVVFGGVGSNRSLTITPAANQHGDVLLTISVFDGLAISKTSFTVTFQPVNDPPFLAPVPDFVMSEGQTLIHTNVAGDPERASQTLWFSLTGAPASATINPADGVFAWAPGETQGSSTNLISVIVADDGMPSLSATQTFTVIVLETNDPPALAAIPHFTMTEGETLAFTNRATDADVPVNVLSFSVANAPTNAAINSGDGVFIWTSTEAQGGSTNFISVIVTDDGAPSQSATQSFTVIVVETNSAPTLATIPDYTVYEGETLSFTNAASDPDLPANEFTFSLGNAPATAALNPSSGVFTWMPDEAQGPGTNLISLIVTDNGAPGLSATQNFTVIVLESNVAPQLAVITDFTITEGETLTFISTATDSDLPPNQLGFNLANAPAGAQIDSVSGVFQWTPDEAHSPGTNLISVIVTDDGAPSLSATQSFTVVVLETNREPILAAVPEYLVIEGELLTFTNLASDADVPPNALTFNLANAPVNATLDPTNGTFVWNTGEADGPATHVFSVIVSDDGSPSLSATQTVTVIVRETNAPPVLATIPDYFVYEGEILTFTNNATDADLPGNTLTFSLADAPLSAVINPTNGVFNWTPDESQGDGTNLISVVVTDDGTPGLSATQSFTVIVLESNTAPLLAPIENYTIAEGENLMFPTSAADADQPPNTLTFSLVGAPANAVIDPENGWFTWTPAESEGPATNFISIIVADDGRPGLSATQTFTVVVLEVNDWPVLGPIADVSIPEGQTLTITNRATDADAPENQLYFSLANAPTNAWIDSKNGVFVWTPDETQGPSAHVVTVIVSDDGVPSLSATQSFTVFVLETNLPPALAEISDFKIHAGMTWSFTNAATDPDTPPNELAFSVDSDAPAGAGIGAADGVFTWTPADTDANTVRSITVRVTDDGVPPLDDAHTFLVTVVSRPTITGMQFAGDVANVTWTSLAGQGYRLQFKTNVMDADWTDVLPDVIASGASAAQTNTFDASGTRVYRVKLMP